MVGINEERRGRPAFSQRPPFFRYLKRNASSVKYRNLKFSELEDMFSKDITAPSGKTYSATRKSLKEWIETMTEEEHEELKKDGLKLEIKEIKFRDSTFKYVYIDPPGVFVEGYWLLLPRLRMVTEDAVTLALKGELLEYWNERPRFPRVRALREFFSPTNPSGG